jgi:hypothetical protein
MMKQEFETLVGCEIPQNLYDFIELDYMDTSESKVEFVQRVYGDCKYATEVFNKFITARCEENRKALQGNPSATEEKLRSMDATIYSHYAWTLN